MDSQMERWTAGCVRMSIQKRDMHQNWHHLGKRMVLRLFPILEQTHLTRVVRCLSPCGGFQVSWRVAAVPKRWCIVIILSMLYDMVMTCMVISATVFWTAFSIWWFQICLIFTLNLGEDFSNLTSILQMGWNHQPVFFSVPPKKRRSFNRLESDRHPMSTGKKLCFVSGFHVGTRDYYTRPLKRDIRAAPERKGKDPTTGRVVSCTCGCIYIYIFFIYMHILYYIMFILYYMILHYITLHYFIL